MSSDRPKAEKSSPDAWKRRPHDLLQLIERYRDNRDSYQDGHYNETQLRREFVDPLFKMLGWDVTNEQGWAERYKEVIHEDSIKVEGSTKAPDYCFRVGGARKFFVETKKPAWNLRDASSPAYQLRRYAWSAKLPISVLTDFEEFVVYDCRQRPRVEDAAGVARILYLTWEEYFDRWPEIDDVLSKEAVLKGAFDRYAETATDKKGTEEVGAAFLQEIETWREKLARSLAKKNKDLTQRELNFSVQRIIDRVIFLRICEARGLEEYSQLRALLKYENPYKELTTLFRRADERYNSGLFHFEQEKGREERPDRLTLGLNVEPSVLKGIVQHLYYPESPYEFSVLPADILGQVYEQFLGKVIRLTPSHQAKVDEKPEVRKAGGVYYTPTHVVEFIVSATLGPLLEGRSPRQISGEGSGADAHPLRVLDPACGSGSFLIAAYQYLMDWYLSAYTAKNPERWTKGKSPRIFQAKSGDWVLTIDERKRILLSHIYGVDVDAQAVEVTKLSLLLKVLEGEYHESIPARRLFHERALPDLGFNIKRGNSLIDTDFAEELQLNLDVTPEEPIAPFNWSEEFASVFADGGFDCVIGNPPYVDSEWMVRFLPTTRSYCSQRYRAASGNWDLFCVFIERALQLCRPGGFSSLIVPNKLISANYAAGAREVLAARNHLVRLRDYSSVPVFPVAVYPIVYVARAEAPDGGQKVLVEGMESTPMASPVVIAERTYDYASSFASDGSPWRVLTDSSDAGPTSKVLAENVALADVADVTGAATVSEAYEMAELIKESSTSSDALKFVNSGTIDRFRLLWGEKPTRYLGSKFEAPVIPRRALTKLSKTRRRQATSPKVIVAGMTKVLESVADPHGEVVAGKSTTVIVSDLDLAFLTALINSDLMAYVYRDMFGGDALQGGYLRIGPPQLRQIPIAVPETDPEIKVAKEISRLSNELAALLDKVVKARTPEEEIEYEKTAKRIERRINELVNALYQLDEKEIGVIQAATSGS